MENSFARKNQLKKWRIATKMGKYKSSSNQRSEEDTIDIFEPVLEKKKSVYWKQNDAR